MKHHSSKFVEYIFNKLIKTKMKNSSLNYKALFEKTVEENKKEIDELFGKPYSANYIYGLLTTEQKSLLEIGRKFIKHGEKRFDEKVLKVFPYVYKKFYNTEKKIGGTYSRFDCYKIAVETCQASGFTNKQIPTYPTVLKKYLFFNS